MRDLEDARGDDRGNASKGGRSGHRVAVLSRSFGSTSQEPWEVLEAHGCRVTPLDEDTGDEELTAALQGVAGIIVGGHPVTGALIRSCPALRVISMNGVGVDHIDLETATKRGVVVTNCPGTNANGVAELTIGLMLAVARPIISGNDALKTGQWGHFPGIELKHKTLGLIGMGAIGTAVARLAMCFGMRVLASDPNVDVQEITDLAVMPTPLDELLSSADFISLHAPLNENTAGIICRKTLAIVKPTAYLINTARGELVDEAALAEALREGRLAGAGLDVFAEEPPRHSDLIGMPNVVATPHIGSHSVESTARTSVMAARNTVLALGGEHPINRVN